MIKAKALKILEEYNRRYINKPNFLDPDFPKQNALIESEAPLIAVQCTRRAGKSTGVFIKAAKICTEKPNASVLITCTTRQVAKDIFIQKIYKPLDKKYKLKTTYNKSELLITFPNGSTIKLMGVDHNADDMEKVLGQQYDLIILDEAAFYKQDQEKMIYEIMKPAVADTRGQIIMISTTSSYTNTLYYNVMNGKEKGWELHKWSYKDNPHMRENMALEVAELLKNKPGYENTPAYIRMYKNEWFVDLDALIYKFTQDNLINEIPLDQYHYVLGVDLGYNDDTAFVVCAYNNYNMELYVVEVMKKPHMIVADVAKQIELLDKKYNFDTFVIDNASKQVVEELKRRYSIPFIAAEKQGKREYIELLNSDLILKNIILGPNTNALTKEWSELVWDEKLKKKGIYKERDNCANHLSDAFLYAWRWCFNYSSKPKIVPLKRGTEAEVEEYWQKQEEYENENE